MILEINTADGRKRKTENDIDKYLSNARFLRVCLFKPAADRSLLLSMLRFCPRLWHNVMAIGPTLSN